MWGPPKKLAISIVINYGLCGRYNELVTGDDFMVYKPTFTSLGGPILYSCFFFPCFSSPNGKLSVIFSFAVVSLVVSPKNIWELSDDFGRYWMIFFQLGFVAGAFFFLFHVYPSSLI